MSASGCCRRLDGRKTAIGFVLEIGGDEVVLTAQAPGTPGLIETMFAQAAH
jgi:hypothetical protein